MGACLKCGQPAKHPRVYCSNACRPRGACRNCAASIRYTQAFCSTACRSAQSGLKGTCGTCGAKVRKRAVECRVCYRKRADRTIRPCGNPECGGTVRYANRYCKPECRPEPHLAKCSQCGNACPRGRRTCTDECLAVLTAARSRIGIRTEAQRAVSSLQKKTKYKRADKATRIAELMSLQDGKCAVCEMPKDLFLDHNHDTGEARLLLCRNCNIAFGQMRERPDIIERLMWYAEVCKST